MTKDAIDLFENRLIDGIRIDYRITNLNFSFTIELLNFPQLT